MDSNRDGKRRRDKHDDESDRRKEKMSRRARSRSKSPANDRDKGARRKRRHSKSRSPDALKQVKQINPTNDTEIKKEGPERRARDTDMLNTRTGGAYIPPARLRMMQAQITDKSSMAYQRLAWEALKKSIHGHINKINVGNIGIIIKELLKENIVRGRGLLCRSVIQAQAASPTFTNVYAALVSAVNSRFPNIGELLLKRLVIQFKRGFKRNDKATCISSVSFVAHLINQRVAHEILALELLTLLVESPTDDSVEVAIAFLKECGQKLTEVSSKGVNAIFEMLRNILHEGQLDKRVQYMIEVMFQVWKDGFKDHPALIEELELVPEEEQFTHLLMLDDATDPQDILNVFKFDDKYEENEQKYKNLSKEILGSDAEPGEEDGSGESGSEESEDEDDETQKPVTIIDNTETNLVALRRTIYLTINSSLDFEECAHKLMKMQLKPGQEVELCHMFLDCCAEQRTYEKFYGLLAQRFCNLNRIYVGPFEEIFKDSYSTAHRLDTNRLRNVSKFFAHLLFTDSISWEVLECVKLNEEDTTSSSRIYIKILFQELAEYMGLKKLNDRLKDPTLQGAFSGVFPRDNPKNTRFSINFFTSIGLGGLTDELREHLKQMPKNVPPPITDINIESSSSSSSSGDSSSSSSSDSSSSDSEDEGAKNNKRVESKKKNDKKNDKTPKTPEVEPEKAERWGHDGFYDTYGQGARRAEPRPDRRENDRDNISRMANRKDYSGKNNRGDQNSTHDRRNKRYDNNREEFSKNDTRDRDDINETRSNKRGEDYRNNLNKEEARRSDIDRRDREDRRNEYRGEDRSSGRDRNDHRRIERDRNDDRDTSKNLRKNSDHDEKLSDRGTDRDRRKEYRDRDDESRNNDRYIDDRRNDREKDDHRRNDRELDDSGRQERNRRDDRNERRVRDNDDRDKHDDRQNNDREREKQQHDIDQYTNNVRRRVEDNDPTSKRRDREEKLERYWNPSEKLLIENEKSRKTKLKDSDSDDRRSKNKNKEDTHERRDRKTDSEEEGNKRTSKRPDKVRDEDDGKSRRQNKDEDRKKKSKEDSGSEEKSSRKNKQKKKDKNVDDSSDSSDEEDVAGKRYWDEMDLKNKKSAQEYVKLKNRARRARS